jgi:small subunit ribosomal protein S14
MRLYMNGADWGHVPWPLPPNSLPIRLRNRCWKTGRSRGVYRDFGLSRHVIREMAHQCLLPGLIKASW